MNIIGKFLLGVTIEMSEVKALICIVLFRFFLFFLICKGIENFTPEKKKKIIVAGPDSGNCYKKNNKHLQ